MIEAVVGFVGTFMVFIGLFAVLYLIIKGHEAYNESLNLDSAPEDDGEVE